MAKSEEWVIQSSSRPINFLKFETLNKIPLVSKLFNTMFLSTFWLNSFNHGLNNNKEEIQVIGDTLVDNAVK